MSDYLKIGALVSQDGCNAAGEYMVYRPQGSYSDEIRRVGGELIGRVDSDGYVRNAAGVAVYQVTYNPFSERTELRTLSGELVAYKDGNYVRDASGVLIGYEEKRW